MVVDFKICYLLNMFKKSLVFFLVVSLSVSMVAVPQAQAAPLLSLPEPGSMVGLSHAYQPAMIKGITVHKDNPFLFDFIMDPGQDGLKDDALQQEGAVQIKYFLAALTVPAKELWVNLSPYEKDRTINNALGQTDMGRDMLAQDYILKQLTASLIYPEKALGKTFWDKVYAKTNNVPVNTFNKVWIMADQAEVYEHGQTAFVTKSHLKVMLEEDYLATQKHGIQTHKQNPSAQAIRDVILPELEREVNEGKHFAPLRQIFNAIILAGWYKNNLKASILNQAYADKSMVKGIDLKDKDIKEKIFERYVQAYKKGVFNYVKDTSDLAPRKYFSGGIDAAMASDPMITNNTPNLGSEHLQRIKVGLIPSLTEVVKPEVLIDTNNNDVAKIARFIADIHRPELVFDNNELGKFEALLQYEINGGETSIPNINIVLIESTHNTIFDPENKDGIWEWVGTSSVRLKDGVDVTEAQVVGILGQKDSKKLWPIIMRAKRVGTMRHDLENHILSNTERPRVEEILKIVNYLERLYDFRTSDLINEADRFYQELQNDVVVRSPFEKKLIALLDYMMSISVHDLEIYKLRKESFGKMLDMRAEVKKLFNSTKVKALVAAVNEPALSQQQLEVNFNNLKANVNQYLDFIDVLVRLDPKHMSKEERIVWLSYLKGGQINLALLIKYFSNGVVKQDDVQWPGFIQDFVNGRIKDRLSKVEFSRNPSAVVLTKVITESIKPKVELPKQRAESVIMEPFKGRHTERSVKDNIPKFLKHVANTIREYNIAKIAEPQNVLSETKEMPALIVKFKELIEHINNIGTGEKVTPDSFIGSLFDEHMMNNKDKMRKIIEEGSDVDLKFLASIYLILVDPWEDRDGHLIVKQMSDFRTNQRGFLNWIYGVKKDERLAQVQALRAQYTGNQAMAVNGGIDLKQAIEATVIKSGQGVVMQMDSALLKRVQAEGMNALTPVIYQITPFNPQQ